MTGNTNNNGRSGFSMGNSSNSTRRSDLSLVLNNNDLVQLGSSSGSSGVRVNGLNVSNLVQKAPLSGEANQVASFLGLPLDAQDNTSLAGGVRTVVDAFKQATHKDEPAQTANSTPTFSSVPAQVQPPDPTLSLLTLPTSMQASAPPQQPSPQEPPRQV